MRLEDICSMAELMEAIGRSAEKGEKRDALADAHVCLRANQVNYIVKGSSGQIADLPTLITPAHFVRLAIPRFLATPGDIRERVESLISTSRETMITTALVTVASHEIINRPIKWFAEGDLKTTMGPFTLRDRLLQRNAIGVYDQIPVKASFGRDEAKALQRDIGDALREGCNIGVYPEGRVSWRSSIFGWRMEPEHRSFAGVILAVQRARVPCQVLPVGICYQKRQFVLSFGDAIDPTAGKPREIAQCTMEAIKALTSSQVEI